MTRYNYETIVGNSHDIIDVLNSVEQELVKEEDRLEVVSMCGMPHGQVFILARSKYKDDGLKT